MSKEQQQSVGSRSSGPFCPSNSSICEGRNLARVVVAASREGGPAPPFLPAGTAASTRPGVSRHCAVSRAMQHPTSLGPLGKGMNEGCRLKGQKVDYSPSSRRTVNLSFRHSLRSQPQNSSKEKTASTAFCDFFIASVPAWLPCLSTFLPEPESCHQRTAQNMQAAPITFTGLHWEPQAGGDGMDLGG